MIVILRLSVFLFVVYGMFRLLDIDIREIKKDISRLFEHSELRLKKKILIAKGKKKENSFRKLIREARTLLELGNKKGKFETICFISVSGTVGALVFSFTIGNIYLSIPLCSIFLVSPFIYVRYSSQRLEKYISEELETALSIITNSYIRNENIILAVEENINYINEPIKKVFKAFITDCNYINPDVKENLRRMRHKINNEVFVEYCNALILCQNDITMKSTLYGIVKKLSNIRIVTARLDGLLYAPVKEFFSMVLIYFINLPFFYILNKDWYRIVVHTTAGHIMLSVSLSVIFFSVVKVLKLTRPIVYRR